MDTSSHNFLDLQVTADVRLQDLEAQIQDLKTAGMTVDAYLLYFSRVMSMGYGPLPEGHFKKVCQRLLVHNIDIPSLS